MTPVNRAMIAVARRDYATASENVTMLREALDKARHYIRFGNGQQQNLKGERGDALRAVEAALGL